MDLISFYIGFMVAVVSPIIIFLVLKYDWEIGKEKKR